MSRDAWWYVRFFAAIILSLVVKHFVYHFYPDIGGSTSTGREIVDGALLCLTTIIFYEIFGVYSLQSRKRED